MPGVTLMLVSVWATATDTKFGHRVAGFVGLRHRKNVFAGGREGQGGRRPAVLKVGATHRTERSRRPFERGGRRNGIVELVVELAYSELGGRARHGAAGPAMVTTIELGSAATLIAAAVETLTPLTVAETDLGVRAGLVESDCDIALPPLSFGVAPLGDD